MCAGFSLTALEGHVYIVLFQVLHFAGAALFGRPPFKNVIVNGLVLARLVCISNFLNQFLFKEYFTKVPVKLIQKLNREWTS